MPVFSKIADMAADGCLVKPLLVGFLTSDAVFRLKIDAERSRERVPDGWFHPSTHASLPVQDLVNYLTAPKVRPGGRDYVFTMAALMGTLMGEISRQALEEVGIAIPVPKDIPCPACGRPRPSKCREHAAVDQEYRSTGHLDGILNFIPGQATRDLPRRLDEMPADLLGELHGFDMKTAKPSTMSGIQEMSLEAFRLKWPRYWWQAQEYMRLTGLRRYIVLVQAMGTPWTAKEFHIPFDADAAADTERRYRQALDAVAGLT